MDTLTTLREVLEQDIWKTVNKQLLAKMLAEFAFEELLVPTVIDEEGDEKTYRLRFDSATYRYRARRGPFDSYRVIESSIDRRPADSDRWFGARSPIQFLIDASNRIDIDDVTLAHLVREYYHTLVADAHFQSRKRSLPDSQSILDLPYAELEGELQGHPWFTANKGRVGFGYDDYLAYAPERKEPQSVYWVAVHRGRATFESVQRLSYDTLISEEIGDDRPQFDSTVSEAGADPEDYYYLPVHEWQWHNVVAQLFAPDIATNDIIPVGIGSDTYLPQQSIRTLTNVDDPTKRYVKLPVSILNTMVYRGLPGDMTVNASRVTEYIKGIRADDRFLRVDCDVVLPGEVAGINYEHGAYSEINGSPYQYTELLGAVWRESVEGLIEPNERPIPLAALMEKDIDDSPVVTELVSRSSLCLEVWLDRLFDVFLHPLLHYLYRYGVGFMPHGTNAILILDDDSVPSRLAIKDYVDEIAVCDERLPELERLPDDLYASDALLERQSPEELSRRILGTAFVCVFRYVSGLLAKTEGYEEEQFWRGVYDSIIRYQNEFPEMADRFEMFDLFRPTFTKSCLNRSRLVEYGYEDLRTEPAVSTCGTVTNTLSQFDT